VDAESLIAQSKGPDQQMAVLRHQNIADDPEAQLRPEIIERSGELKPEPVRIENAGAAWGQFSRDVAAGSLPMGMRGRAAVSVRIPRAGAQCE